MLSFTGKRDNTTTLGEQRGKPRSVEIAKPDIWPTILAIRGCGLPTRNKFFTLHLGLLNQFVPILEVLKFLTSWACADFSSSYLFSCCSDHARVFSSHQVLKPQGDKDARCVAAAGRSSIRFGNSFQAVFFRSSFTTTINITHRVGSHVTSATRMLEKRQWSC